MLIIEFFIVFRLVGFHWFSSSRWAWPQETSPVRHSDSEYPWKIACCTSRRHWDNSIPPVQPLSATAGRVLDARCGLSTRGHWDAPIICNEAGSWSVCCATWRKVPWDHAKAPCLGHSPLGSEGPTPIQVSSSSCAAVGAGACLVWWSASDLLWNWAGANQVLHTRVGRCGPKWKST